MGKREVERSGGDGSSGWSDVDTGCCVVGLSSVGFSVCVVCGGSSVAITIVWNIGRGTPTFFVLLTCVVIGIMRCVTLEDVCIVAVLMRAAAARISLL